MANWRVLYYLYVEDNELMDEHSWEGTKWLDLITEEVAGDYYVRTKKRLSGFYPTDLEFLLHNLDVHNVVITGTMTDACVLSTAFDAANRDFRVIVPRDVVGGYSGRRSTVHFRSSRSTSDWLSTLRPFSPSTSLAGIELPQDLVGMTDINEVTGVLQKSTV